MALPQEVLIGNFNVPDEAVDGAVAGAKVGAACLALRHLHGEDRLVRIGSIRKPGFDLVEIAQHEDPPQAFVDLAHLQDVSGLDPELPADDLIFRLFVAGDLNGRDPGLDYLQLNGPVFHYLQVRRPQGHSVFVEDLVGHPLQSLREGQDVEDLARFDA